MSKDCAYQGVISLICDLEGTEAVIRSPWEGYSLVRQRTCTEINFCSYPSLAFISSCFLLLPTEKWFMRLVLFKLPRQQPEENHFSILFLAGPSPGSPLVHCRWL